MLGHMIGKNFLGKFASAVFLWAVVLCVLVGSRGLLGTGQASGHDAAGASRGLANDGSTYTAGIHESTPTAQCPLKMIQIETADAGGEEHLIFACAVPITGMPFDGTTDAVGFATMSIAFTDSAGATIAAGEMTATAQVAKGSGALTSPALDLSSLGESTRLYINTGAAGTGSLDVQTDTADQGGSATEKVIFGSDFSGANFEGGDLLPCQTLSASKSLSGDATGNADKGLDNNNEFTLVNSSFNGFEDSGDYSTLGAALKDASAVRLVPVYVHYEMNTVTDRVESGNTNTLQLKHAVVTYSFAYDAASRRGDNIVCTSGNTNLISNPE